MGQIKSIFYQGSGQTNLADNSAFNIAPFWSPDGKSIVFISDRDGDFGIYIINVDDQG